MGKGKGEKPGVSVKLKGLHTPKYKRADGSPTTYYYAWRGGPKLDVGEEPTPEELARAFYDTHDAFKRSRLPDPRSTITAALLSRYINPEEYEGRSEKWYKEKVRHVGILREEFGEDDITVFDDPAILDDLYGFRNSMRDTPTKANHVMAELAAFLGWCRKRGVIEKNLAAGIDRFEKKKRAHIIWTENEIDAVCREATPAARPLIRAAVLTGLDRADLVALNWSEVGEDGFIRHRRAKTVELAVIPIYGALADVLNALPKASPKVFLNGRKQPWTADGFSTGFRRAKIKAGIDKRFKDLRGTAATYFYQCGLGDEDVAEIMGWSEETCKEIRREYVTDAARADGLIIQLNKARTKV